MKVIVCGAGQVGSTIARHLATEGIDVTVIDIDQKQVRLIDESYDVRGVVGHASYPSILEKAGAHDADMLIAVTRSDEVNMVACQMAYTLFGVKRRIARLRHAGYLAQGETGLYAAEHMPIDVIISPEIEIAESIAHRLKTPGAFDMLPLADGKVALLGIHADANNCDAVGQTFSSLSGGGTGEGMSVLAVLREGRCFIPRDEDVLELGDDVYIIAHTGGVDHVMAAFGHRETEARRVIIVGGGNVGLHLAQRLRRDTPDVDIKIIELSPSRAEYVAQQMGRRVVVLQGDALDRDMLKEAQVGSTETVVAVTDDDETNIFASVLAKRAGCERAITLVNKRSYEALMPTLGIDAAVSPSAVTISTVLRHVRHGAISALYTLREDFGEVIEAELSSTSPLLRGRLADLDLPSGMKVGAVMRNGSVLIAGGDTQLEAGDRVIALVTYQHLRAAAGLLGGKPTAA
jgi:trk system potassium uptake protein TrkA